MFCYVFIKIVYIICENICGNMKILYIIFFKDYNVFFSILFYFISIIFFDVYTVSIKILIFEVIIFFRGCYCVIMIWKRY